MPAFTLASVDVESVERFVRRVFDALQAEDLGAWQRVFDALGGVRVSPPTIAADGTPVVGVQSITDPKSCPLTRDALPEVDEALASALQIFVVRSAEFVLRGRDELRGHFVDWLPGAGFLRAPEHVEERAILERLLFAPAQGIPEPFDFLELTSPRSYSSLVRPDELGALLEDEGRLGLLAHLGREVPAKYPAEGRDLELLLPFLRLVHAAGLGLYYFE